MRRFFSDMDDAWDDIRVDPEAYFDLGQSTLAYYVLRGHGHGSGMKVEMPVALAVKWRNGLVARFKGYADRAHALTDLGVSADELDPIAPDVSST